MQLFIHSLVHWFGLFVSKVLISNLSSLMLIKCMPWCKWCGRSSANLCGTLKIRLIAGNPNHSDFRRAKWMSFPLNLLMTTDWNRRHSKVMDLVYHPLQTADITLIKQDTRSMVKGSGSGPTGVTEPQSWKAKFQHQLKGYPVVRTHMHWGLNWLQSDPKKTTSNPFTATPLW